MCCPMVINGRRRRPWICLSVLFPQEEVAKLQRKLERSQKIEQAGAADEVLLEEIKEYKV